MSRALSLPAGELDQSVTGSDIVMSSELKQSATGGDRVLSRLKGIPVVGFLNFALTVVNSFTLIIQNVQVNNNHRSACSS